jgi:hypothetical protein
MPKRRMKFVCEDCNKENWLFEDFDELKANQAIIFCSVCGYVRGPPEKTRPFDDKSCWLDCIPFHGIERKRTTGVITGVGKETLWSADVGGTNLTRVEYMEKYGIDPWTDWCFHHPDNPISQDNGFGRSYKDILKASQNSNQERS